ncbi:histone acetyltransferase, partial [[Clostridium] symbiosum]|nr:histone acetyltransferase [[Clostridium] symbiosum]
QERFEAGEWAPYSEAELLDILVSDVAATPPFCRISRMIRDFSSHDIVAGNKKPNLRQLVENRLRSQGDVRGIQ